MGRLFVSTDLTYCRHGVSFPSVSRLCCMGTYCLARASDLVERIKRFKYKTGFPAPLEAQPGNTMLQPCAFRLAQPCAFRYI